MAAIVYPKPGWLKFHHLRILCTSVAAELSAYQTVPAKLSMTAVTEANSIV